MQIVSPGFHAMAQNSVIPIDWQFNVSFTKDFEDSVTFFTLNVSELNGIDVLSPSEDNPLQEWDKYEYTPYGDRVISMEWQRTLDFPYSVQSALADITLNNYDDYFTPRSSSPIQEFILPKRPMRIYTGFRTVGVIPQLVGLSQGMPEISQDKTAGFHVLDFLSEMFTMELTKTIAMQDVTTDVVLSSIFEQFGLLPTQYSLAKGRNVIPFLFFERGLNAGNIFRQLMQAEMGKLWLDELGIIRFEERLSSAETSVMTFNENNIITAESTGDDEIINDIRITSNIRAVQAFQPIYTNAQEEDSVLFDPTITFRIPASGSAFYPDANLNDPAISAVDPTIGRKADTSWFTAVNIAGVEVTSNITITLSELRTNSFTMLFSNANAFDVYITQVEVWGEPAKIVDVIDYRAFDDDSVEKYGTQLLEVNNDFFGSISNCDSFAEYTLDAYKEFAGVIMLGVKGDPSLQLADVIDVDYQAFTDSYKVIGLKNALRNNSYSQIITARHYTPRMWFILDQSELNGTDVLAP